MSVSTEQQERMDTRKSERQSFIIDTIIFTVAVLLSFSSNLFRALPGISFSSSKVILWAMVIGLITAGGLLRVGLERSVWSILKNVLFPFGIYTAITYWPLRPRLVRAFAVVIAILSVVYVIVTLLQKSYRSDPKGFWILKIKYSIIGTQSIISVGFAILMAIFLGYLLIGSSLFIPANSPSVSEIDGDNLEERLISEASSELSLLHPDDWDALDMQSKVNVLSKVAEIEVARLGLPHELNICIKNMGEDELGGYVDSNHCIILDAQMVDTEYVRTTLEALFHECAHALEYRMAEAYLQVDSSLQGLISFQESKKYAAEFNRYIDGKDDYHQYENQSCEETANHYASQEWLRFQNIISECRGEEPHDFKFSG